MKEFQIDEMSAVKDDEIEIDLLELLRAYRKKLRACICGNQICDDTGLHIHVQYFDSYKRDDISFSVGFTDGQSADQ